ncbi:putative METHYLTRANSFERASE [Salix purpurea]|uniref:METHYLTRANSFERASE n=1 Tax=Salix purpurea TaxID=77065 RepID=A0A9Q0UB41_SALPP|nr:putative METHYLTRANSFERASE [Salix purpurea]
MATHFTLSLSPSKPFKNSTFFTKNPFLHFKKPLFITSFQSPQPAAAAVVQTFWQWLSDQDVVSAKTPAKPGLVPQGLGLVAQRDISRNEVVLEIPKKLWINPDVVAASEIGNVCSGLKPWCRSEEELAELQGTQLLSTTLGVKSYLQREFLKVEEEILVPHKQLFTSPVTLDDFSWAFGILRSRSFSRLRGQNLVLIPLADLVNHSPDITIEDGVYEIKGAGLFSRDLIFSLRSPISLKAGEQVLIQYNLNMSNAELAVDYGFIEAKSDRNMYTLTLQISESDPFFGDKLDIAETNGLGEIADFDIVLGNPLPPTLLPYLRLVALGGTDVFLLESIFRNTIWGHLELPVSRANEELICRVVRDACKSALSGYHTTIEEDEKLKRKELNPRLEIAVGIRAEEKKVLQQIDKIFKQRQSELDELEYYQERRLKDLGLVGEQGEIIFWESK